MSEVTAHAVTGLSNTHDSFPSSPSNGSALDLGFFTPSMNLWPSDAALKVFYNHREMLSLPHLIA